MNRRFPGRRSARGGNQGGGDLEAAIDAITPYSWMEADYYSVDGVSGKIASFLDKVAAGTGIKAIKADHAYAQTTSANQCALPAAQASLGNRMAADFALSQYYDSNAAASAWRAPHDGTGFESFVVLDRTTVTGVQYTWSTYVYSITVVGAGQLTNAANISSFVINAGTATVNITVAGETTGATYVNTSTALADTPDAVLRRRSVSIGTTNATAGYAAGDPFATMRIGAHSTGGSTLNAKVAMVLFFNRTLSAGDRTTVRNYITAKFGVT